MKNLYVFAIFILFAIIFSGCPFINNKPLYREGFFPRYPVNFYEVNSEYDDYNMALPIIRHTQYLYFSSNRNSAGQEFDVIGDNLHIWWDMETGLLSISNSETYYNTDFTDTLFKMINTPANEFGPYALNYWTSYNQNEYARYDLITYSSNYETNSFKSKFVYFQSDGSETGTYHGPFEIHMIDYLTDAQYISFFSEEIDDVSYWNIDPNKFEQLIFNANIDGSNGIYSIALPESDDFIEMLKSDTIITPVRISTVNSISEDKCPFVNASLMVFTSNRSGGFGGYDLYYSWYENGIWSKPVNFGETINTEFDEFRPVTIEVENFKNDLMIFSSNRPGGKGGFDLYYVGLPFKVRDFVNFED
ncbi:MAG: hypothetical protein H8E34_02220 [Bacteroidetes bacterium]|nr:hypothetical protein [Bacteroidota bacterium]